MALRATEGDEDAAGAAACSSFFSPRLQASGRMAPFFS
jgi:hypothetical protein